MDSWFGSVVFGLSLGAGLALVFLPLNILIRSWLGTRASDKGSDAEAKQKAGAISQEEAREILLRLHRVADNVGRDVTAHTAEIETISQGLAGKEEPTMRHVLDAVEQVVRANEKMQRQLDQAKATIEQQAELIGTQMVHALTDALTGIANRRAFDHEFQRRIAEYRRKRRPFCLLLCDVDHFKRFNDSYGHVAGDEALREVAARLTTSVREMDLPARYGGEEFGIILPDTDSRDAKLVAERVRVAICEQPFQIDGHRVTVTASIGLTQCFRVDDTEISIVKRADEALYASKQAGRNCGHYHDGKQLKLFSETSRHAVEDGPTRPGGSEQSAPADPEVVPDALAVEASTTRTDKTTGLPTRAPFEEELARRLKQQCHTAEELAVLLLEIDDYHEVIAAHGQWESVIARALRQIVSGAVGSTSPIARLADDQFAAILLDKSPDDAIETARRLRRAVARCDSLGDSTAPIRFTASVGTTQAEVGESAAEVLTRLQRTTMAARNEGGNCVFACRQGQVARVPDPSASGDAVAHR